MLRVALPNKGTLAEPAATMMREAGYRQRSDSRDLSIADDENDIEFFYLRPKDIATYVGSGDLHLGVTGADLKEESGSQVQSLLELGFGACTLTLAVPRGASVGSPAELGGARVATSFPRLTRGFFETHGVEVQVVEVRGAVEVTPQLGVADAVVEVERLGGTLMHRFTVPGMGHGAVTADPEGNALGLWQPDLEAAP